LKCEDKIAVIDLAPAEIVLQRSLQDADDLAIHIVFHYAEQENGADDPAETSDVVGEFGGDTRLRSGGGFRNRGEIHKENQGQVRLAVLRR
jgi:hypothetical protein